MDKRREKEREGVGRRGKEREGEGRRRRGMERKGERRSGKEREGALIYEPLIYLIYIVHTSHI